MKNLFYLLVFSCSLVFLNSCAKEEVITPSDQTVELEELSPELMYKFKKDVTIFTDDKEEAVMRIYSDDENGLENYSAANFTVTKINANETMQDALVRNGIMDLSAEQNQAELNDEEMLTEEAAKSAYAFQIISSKITGNYSVSFNHPETIFRADWNYYTHYSSAGQGLEQSVSIARHSWNRRVYYGLKYKAYSSSSWSLIQNEWRKLSNNETVSYDRNPCHQFRARIKTKSSSAYSVNFFY